MLQPYADISSTKLIHGQFSRVYKPRNKATSAEKTMYEVTSDARNKLRSDTFEITSAIPFELWQSVRNSRAFSTISNGCYELTVERQRANSVEPADVV
jgi:hypothetical protein